MGKLPYLYTDSDEAEDTSSFVENTKKKKKFSILKYTTGNVKKKKCQLHSKSEPDDSDYRSRSRSSQRGKYRLQGILKKDREMEIESSEEEDEIDYAKLYTSRDRCLVGRVPRPAGAKPGRGGGVAIVVKKNVNESQPLQLQSTSSSKRRFMKRITRKRSY